MLSLIGALGRMLYGIGLVILGVLLIFNVDNEDVHFSLPEFEGLILIGLALALFGITAVQADVRKQQ